MTPDELIRDARCLAYEITLAYAERSMRAFVDEDGRVTIEGLRVLDRLPKVAFRLLQLADALEWERSAGLLDKDVRRLKGDV